LWENKKEKVPGLNFEGKRKGGAKKLLWKIDVRRGMGGSTGADVQIPYKVEKKA